MCEEYNGWKNRETWAMALHLSNDQGLYEMTRDRVADAVGSYEPGEYGGSGVCPDWFVGDAVQAMWEEISDPDEEMMSAESILTIVRDVGSEYRIDWAAVAASFRDES